MKRFFVLLSLICSLCPLAYGDSWKNPANGQILEVRNDEDCKAFYEEFCEKFWNDLKFVKKELHCFKQDVDEAEIEVALKWYVAIDIEENFLQDADAFFVKDFCPNLRENMPKAEVYAWIEKSVKLGIAFCTLLLKKNEEDFGEELESLIGKTGRKGFRIVYYLYKSYNLPDNFWERWSDAYIRELLEYNRVVKDVQRDFTEMYDNVKFWENFGMSIIRSNSELSRQKGSPCCKLSA